MSYKILVLIVILFVGGGVILFQKERSFRKEYFSGKKGVKIEDKEVELEGKERLEKSNENSEIILTSVYDNYLVNPELKTSWGFGLTIKTPFEEILFDTGGDSSVLLFNMRKLSIDPKSIDKVVISHVHGDHLGGLEGFLKENSKVKVYIPSSFPDSVRKMIKSYGAEFVDISGPSEISKIVFSTGEMYGPPEEQSLVINSRKGLIVITGCAHPGIVNIVKKVKEMFPQKEVYLVLGGFHHPPEEVIYKLKELKVEKVAPSHCSGDEIRELFRKEYKENFIENGVGKIIEI